MTQPIRTSCPSCDKTLTVPAEVAGKTIRCKACQATFTVPGAAPAARAKPARAKPSTKSGDGDPPIKFADDPPAGPAGSKVKRPFDDEDGEENANPYGVTKDELDVPRCPFCANELDPPDTRVCLSCGYDLLDRKRHGSKKVYELTTGEYVKHWLPAFLWLTAVAVVVGTSILFYLQMYDWLEGTILQQEEEDFATKKKKWYVEPLCFNIFFWVFSAFITIKGLRFAYQRLVLNWRPEETIKKT